MPSQQLLGQAHAVFRFVVKIDSIAEAAFTECTLPVLDLETEEIKEGGLNEFVHLLPGHRKSARLTLKNGVGKSELVDWCNKTMSGQFQPKTVTIHLLDSKKSVVASWEILNAYPTKWTGPNLKSDDNSVAIQTLELACGQVSVTI